MNTHKEPTEADRQEAVAKRLDGSTDKDALIESLRSQSAEEVERISRRTDEEIAARQKAVEDQLARIVAEEAQRADAQIEQMERRAKTTEAIESRRRNLALRKKLIEEILQRAEKSARAIVGSERYREAVAEWIIEGVLGLEARNVVVETTSAEAGYVGAAIDEAASRIRELTGNPVEIELSESYRVGSPGIVVRDTGSSRAYDNTITTRLQRYRSDIQRLIVERLYKS